MNPNSRSCKLCGTEIECDGEVFSQYINLYIDAAVCIFPCYRGLVHAVSRGDVVLPGLVDRGAGDEAMEGVSI